MSIKYCRQKFLSHSAEIFRRRIPYCFNVSGIEKCWTRGVGESRFSVESVNCFVSPNRNVSKMNLSVFRMLVVSKTLCLRGVSLHFYGKFVV